MKSAWLKGCLVLLLGFLCSLSPAFALQLAPHHPSHYTVKNTDTLWDVAKLLLAKPWEWPQFARTSPALRHDHHLYPNDELSIARDKRGNVYLHVDRAGAHGGTLTWSPSMRKGPIDQRIPTIPFSAIGPFLSGTLAIEADGLKQCPYVLAFPDERVVAAMGDHLFAKNLCNPAVRQQYTIFRPGDAYRDPKTKEILGYEAKKLGYATVEQGGDPAILLINEAKEEINRGDRLVPKQKDPLPPYFVPRAPTDDIDARIVTVLGGLSQIGQYQVVVLNQGARNGLRPGHVLTIYQDNGQTRDPTIDKDHYVFTKLPETYVGELMVFRALEKLSFALIMHATAPIHVGDAAYTPE
jgi:hypothetical protein